jgi:protein-S-isoprenylcysteine O-methyltransferase Ste14
MKDLFQGLKKEQRLPIAVAIVAMLTTILNIVLLPQVVYVTSDDSLHFTYGIWPTVVFMLFYLTVFVVSLIAIIKAFRFDVRKKSEKKDERELLHEYIVAEKGYTVLMYGIALYLIWVDSFVLPALLALVIILRLRTRKLLNQEK